TVHLDVTNQAPIAAGGSLSVLHDQVLDLIVLYDNASDPDGDPLTFTITTPPAHGTLTSLANGTYQYTPALHFVGTDSFSFTASDGAATSDAATFTIDVTNGAPEVSGGQQS